MTDTYRPRSVHSLLTRSGQPQSAGPIQRLMAKAAQIEQVNQALGGYLESPLSNHCRIADYSYDAVIFHADSPAWSAKLRYRMPSILDFLGREFQLSGRISAKLHVRPPPSATPRSKPRRLKLSAAAAELVESTAAGLRDPTLRASLMRLSRHRD